MFGDTRVSPEEVEGSTSRFSDFKSHSRLGEIRSALTSILPDDLIRVTLGFQGPIGIEVSRKSVSFSLSPNNRYLHLAGSGDSIQITDLRRQETCGFYVGNDEVVWSPDGSRFAFWNSPYALSLYPASGQGKFVQILSPETPWGCDILAWDDSMILSFVNVVHLDWTPFGLVTIHHNHNEHLLVVWDPTTQKQISSCPIEPSDTYLSWETEGSVLLSSAHNNGVGIFRIYPESAKRELVQAGQQTTFYRIGRFHRVVARIGGKGVTVYDLETHDSWIQDEEGAQKYPLVKERFIWGRHRWEILYLSHQKIVAWDFETGKYSTPITANRPIDNFDWSDPYFVVQIGKRIYLAEPILA